jgi:hypothetical protein
MQVTALYRPAEVLLDLHMTDKQLYDAVYTLVGMMTAEKARHLLQTEFPELFTPEDK